LTSAPLRYFDSQANGYAGSSGRGMWAWQRRREAAVVELLAGPAADARVLDLGCGAGFYARRYHQAGARVAAVDASPGMIAALNDSGIEQHLGDAAEIRLDASFDLIISAGLLEFVPDPGRVLANCRAHLASGGRVVVLFPPDNWAGRLYRRFHRSHGFSIYLFDETHFKAMAQSAGLLVVASRLVCPYSMIVRLEAS
jgi:SAM-dependent methyltransferase